nr:hypothetical protein [Tanacetum cinerariifolium]
STTVLTGLGHRDENVFTRLGERRKNVRSRLGPEVAPRHRHATERRNASSNRSAEDPNRRNKNARSLIRSYITCSSEQQREIEEEWYAADRANRRSNGEDDLSQPWLCEETDPFTARIRYFKVLKKTRMPTNVKTYDGTGDPEHHLKKIQAAAKIERWAMPTWCHMFDSTLTGSARKYIKDPVEIHHIKQREGESIEAFMERFKAKSTHVNEAPKCMRISGFMWQQQISQGRKSSHRGDFTKQTTNQASTSSWISRASIKRVGGKTGSHLSQNPQRNPVMETVKFKAPSHMTGPVENRNKNKFKFHGDKGYSTDECIHLRRQIEEAVRSGQLSHLVKEIKKGGKRGENTKATEKGEPPTKRKLRRSSCGGQENLIVSEAEVEGHLIHRMYIDGRSSSEVLYEHCFNKLFPEIKNQMIPPTTPLLGFSDEISWPLGQTSLMVSLRDGEHPEAPR